MTPSPVDLFMHYTGAPQDMAERCISDIQADMQLTDWELLDILRLYYAKQVSVLAEPSNFVAVIESSD